jgi:opacity protein-like surface antigen
MKGIKNKILTLILVLGVASVSNAQLFRSTSKVGTTAGQFLKINPGARAVAMGGALTSIGSDIYSIYYNPAGIAEATTNAQITFNHANWLADMTYDFAAGAIRIEGLGTIFTSLTAFNVPDEKVRTFQNPEGDGRYWNAGALAIGVGYARQLTDRFSFGINAKYVHESIWNSSSAGFAMDIGMLYRTPFNDLKIGASITNYGSKMQLDGRDIQFNYDPNDDINSGPNNVPSKYSMGSFDLPMLFRIGLSMDVVRTRYIRLTTAVDAVHPNDNSEYINSGMEFAYDESFFVRAGYKQLFMNNKEGGLTFGAGIKYSLNDNFKIVLDYGYADYGRLKDVQFFDIGLLF